MTQRYNILKVTVNIPELRKRLQTFERLQLRNVYCYLEKVV